MISTETQCRRVQGTRPSRDGFALPDGYGILFTNGKYFETFVLGNREDCDDDQGRTCIRRAFNAAVSVAHLADHYIAYNRRHKPSLVARFASLDAFNDFVASQTAGASAEIKSIANAYKHLYERDASTKRGGPRWTVASTGSLEAMNFGSDEKRLDEITIDYETDHAADWKVIFRRRNGTRAEFLPTLDAVIAFWSKTL